MATFAEQPVNTMASNDFTLYPYSDQWNQDHSYLPTSTYADQAYINATTFDSYQSQYSYAPFPDQFNDFNDRPVQQSKAHLQAPSAHHSPANSASHSFDYNPAVSDSGASVQSTISSAMGSPSAHPQSSDWHQQQNMYPGIVQQSDSLYATSSFDFETIPATDKGCVGEFTTISSSQLAQDVAHLELLQSPFFVDATLDTSPGATKQWPGRMHAATAERSAAGLSSQPARSGSFEASSPSDQILCSPSAPASATSPVLERAKDGRRSSVLPSATQTPFFTQSSGYFVPPLQSSCPSAPYLPLPFWIRSMGNFG